MTYSRSRRRKRKNVDITDGDFLHIGTILDGPVKDNVYQQSEIDSLQGELTEDQTRKLEICESFREEFFEGF